MTKKPAKFNNKIDEKSKNNFTNIKILQKNILSTRTSNVFTVICMPLTSNNGVSDLKRVQNDEIKLTSHSQLHKTTKDSQNMQS